MLYRNYRKPDSVGVASVRFTAPSIWPVGVSEALACASADLKTKWEKHHD